MKYCRLWFYQIAFRSQLLFELGQLFRLPYNIGYVLFLWLRVSWTTIKTHIILYRICIYNLENRVTTFKIFLLLENHPICSGFRSNPCTSITCRTTTNEKYHKCLKVLLYIVTQGKSYIITCNHESALAIVICAEIDNYYVINIVINVVRI